MEAFCALGCWSTNIYSSRRRESLNATYIKYKVSGAVMKRWHWSEHTLKASQATLNRKSLQPWGQLSCCQA